MFFIRSSLPFNRTSKPSPHFSHSHARPPHSTRAKHVGGSAPVRARLITDHQNSLPNATASVPCTTGTRTQLKKSARGATTAQLPTFSYSSAIHSLQIWKSPAVDRNWPEYKRGWNNAASNSAAAVWSSALACKNPCNIALLFTFPFPVFPNLIAFYEIRSTTVLVSASS